MEMWATNVQLQSHIDTTEGVHFFSHVHSGIYNDYHHHHSLVQVPVNHLIWWEILSTSVQGHQTALNLWMSLVIDFRLVWSEGTSFVVDVGPSGGARGYSAITGTLQEEMSSTLLLWRSHTLIGVILLLHPLCYITNRMLSRLYSGAACDHY